MANLEALQKAIFKGDIQAIRAVIEADTEDVLSQRDKSTGSLALHYAAYVGDIDVVDYLISEGAELEARNSKGETALHIACARKHSKVVEYFVELGSDNCPLSHNGWTPLHCCALYNSTQCAEALALNGNQINSQDINGETALHVACTFNNHWMVNWLLKHQADPEIADAFGRLPIHLACSVGSNNILDELLRRSVSIDKTDKRDRTVIHYASRSPSKQSVTIDIIRIMLQNSYMSAWCIDADGAFPILHAIKSHKMKVAKHLLTCSQGKSSYTVFKTFLYAAAVDTSSSFFNHIRKSVPQDIVEQTDDNGFTALHYAAEYDREDRVTCLISMKADVNAKAKNGITPLHCAAVNGNRYSVEVLLENGADENAVTDDGFTAMHFAASQKYIDVCSMLMASGVDELATDNQGRTALMHLCNVVDETSETCQLLDCFLAVGSGSESKQALIEMKDNYGWTALHYACARGHHSMAMELVKAGADVCARDNHGRNAAHFGVQSIEPLKIIMVLSLKAKTILLQRDEFGFLPVHYAAMKGDPEIVIDLLRRSKSKSRVLPTTGFPYQLSPLHLATIYGQVKTADAIIQYCKSNPEPDSLEDCMRGLESLKIGEDDINSSFESDNKRNYDPLTAEDNLRRIPLHYAMKYGILEMLDVLLPPERCSVLLAWQDKDAANSKERCVQHALKLLEDVEASAVKRGYDYKKRSAAMFSLTAPGNSYKLLINSENCTKKDINLRGFLHRAAFAQKNDAVQNILQWAPAEVNSADINKVTPLHFACCSGNIKGIRILLDAKANLRAEDKMKTTPADWAAAYGKYEVLSFLFDNYRGMMLNCGRIFPDSLLLSDFAILKASEFGYLTCLEKILQHFPDMVRCHRDDETPLHLAAKSGHGRVCSFLVNNGAMMDVLDRNRCTPLMVAAKCKTGTECVAVLVNNTDCPLTCLDQDGNSALHLACLHDNGDSAIQIYNALIKRGELELILRHKNNKMETLLHLAVKMRSTAMTAYLIRHMEDQLHERDYKDRIPLFAMIDDPAIQRNMYTVLMKYVRLASLADLDSTLDSSALDGDILVSSSTIIPEVTISDSNRRTSCNIVGVQDDSSDQGEFESY